MHILCRLIALIGCVYASTGKWSYEGLSGPKAWGQFFEECAGERQSPIDIDVMNVVENFTLSEFVFQNYDTVLENPSLENNGHTAQLTFNSTGRIPAISSGGLLSRYMFLQLHFHWGKSNSEGSEHTINGRQYPLEMHLVHYNEKYDNVKNALKYGDGLAVLGVFFKIGEYNPYINGIIRTLQKVRTPGSKEVVDGDGIVLMDLLPRKTVPFYRYEGSLTTPPCSPAVIWTVFANDLQISEKQLREFRTLTNANGDQLGNNYRPVLKLGERTVQLFSTASHLTRSYYTDLLTLVTMVFLAVQARS